MTMRDTCSFHPPACDDGWDILNCNPFAPIYANLQQFPHYISLTNCTQEQSGQLLTGTNAATPCLARSHRAPLSLSSVRPMLPSCLPKGFRSTQHNNVTQHLTNPRGIRSICAAASGIEHAAAAAQPDSRRLTQQQPPLLATAHLLQLGSGGGGSDVGLLPLGPGVYAVLDESMCVQYIGISRHISDSLTSHIRELPHLACFAKVCYRIAQCDSFPFVSARSLLRQPGLMLWMLNVDVDGCCREYFHTGSVPYSTIH